MAKNTQLSNEVANAQCDATTALAANGYTRIYDGSQPAISNTPVSTQVMLAELRLGSPAFGAAVNGVATANAITPDSNAPATGTAAWFRVFKSDGTSPLWDGTVGTADANLIVSSTAFQ